MLDIVANGGEQEPTARPRRRRLALIAVTLLGLAAVTLVWKQAQSDPEPTPVTAQRAPAADGFTSIGQASGVEFWLRTLPDGRTAVRSSGGRIGYMCNDAGELKAALPLCQGSVQGVGSVLVIPVRRGTQRASVSTLAGEQQMEVLHTEARWPLDLAVLISSDESLVLTGPLQTS